MLGMEITSVTIELPLPDKCLSPNARSHWAKKAKAAKLAKSLAFYGMKAAIEANGLSVPWPAATVIPKLYCKLNRTRDLDNIISSCKNFLDGAVKAGLLVNDCFLRPLPAVIVVNKNNPEKMELLFEKLEKA